MDREVENLSIQLRQDTARLLALHQRKEVYLRLQNAQQITELVCDISAINLRGVSLSVSAISFGLLESMPTTQKTAKIVRQIHDLITDLAYTSILGAN